MVDGPSKRLPRVVLAPGHPADSTRPLASRTGRTVGGRGSSVPLTPVVRNVRGVTERILPQGSAHLVVMLRGDLPSVSAFGGTWEWFVCHGQLRDLCPLSVPGWDIGVNQIVHVAPTELTGSICSISDLEYLMESIV